MAMLESESVSSSLIRLTSLENDEIVSLNAVIDGQNESIIVHRNGEKLSAWLNVCPHAGRRLDYAPGKFLRDGPRLVCAAHGATFALESGECVSGPCRGEHLKAVPVRINEAGLCEFG